MLEQRLADKANLRGKSHYKNGMGCTSKKQTNWSNKSGVNEEVCDVWVFSDPETSNKIAFETVSVNMLDILHIMHLHAQVVT